MLFAASAYYWLNRNDPDCGTSFSWTTRALGPWAGFIAGWAIIVADVIVMANLAQIAGIYTFLLVGAKGLAASTFWVTLVGVVWIAVMTAVCYIGIELSARSQWFLLGAELVTLTVFAVVALVKVYTSSPENSVRPSLSWLDPTGLSWQGLVAGVLVAIFIYWGWDSGVAVNEETEDSSRTPGIAAVVSTVILLAIYVIVSIAAQAFHGAKFLSDNADDVLSALGSDVFPSPLDKLLIIAVLTSASASTQTTILPTSRTALSMARKGAIPRTFGRIHRRYQTPGPATIWMGAASIVWYVGLTAVSQNILYDSIAALGLMIAFYIGLTAFVCVVYYRRLIFRSARNFLLVGLVPLLGGVMLAYVLYRSSRDLSDPANSESGSSWLGLGPPLVIGIGSLLLGLVLMVVQWRLAPAFFRRGAEAAPTDALDPGAPQARA
jgi:amino acid transporter